jgi:DNA polymerase III delta subunit
MLYKESDIQKLINEIKQEKIKYCFFQGSNIGLLCYLVSKLKNNLTIQVESFEFNEIEIPFNLFVDQKINSPNLFGSRKIIKIDGIKDKVSKNLKTLLEQESQITNLLILTAYDFDCKSIKSLFQSSKNAALINCYEDDKNTALDFINNKNLPITQDLKIYLAEKLCKDRLILDSEIEKISLFLANKKQEHKIENQDQIIDLIYTDDQIELSTIADNIILSNRVIVKKITDNISIIQLLRLVISYIKDVINMKKLIEVNKVTSEEVIKTKFIFFKRIALVKKQIAIEYDILQELLKKISEIEIACKEYGEDIALQLLKGLVISSAK